MCVTFTDSLGDDPIIAASSRGEHGHPTEAQVEIFLTRLASVWAKGSYPQESNATSYPQDALIRAPLSGGVSEGDEKISS